MTTYKSSGLKHNKWAMFFREEIHEVNQDNLYMRRLRIVQTPWFGIFLHRLYRPDIDRDLHDHPWPFISVVLRGWYTEVSTDRAHASSTDSLCKTIHFHDWLSVHRFPHGAAHRIYNMPKRRPVWTLVFVGKSRGVWGFWVDGKWVESEAYFCLKSANEIQRTGGKTINTY